MYSMVWSIETIEAHYKAHTRASYFCLVTLGLTTRTLALWLAKRDPRWELYKKACKIVEEHLTITGDLFETTHLFSKLTHLFAKSYEMGGAQLLQELEDGRKLGLQFFKGTPVGRAEEKAERRLPFQPSLFEEAPDDPRVSGGEAQS